MKDEMFVRTIGADVFQSDSDNSSEQEDEQSLESEFKFSVGDDLKNSHIFNCEHDNTICIEHKISTSRELVGLQVWRGAFLLADFILHKWEQFQDKNIVELAAGVGLTSIVAGFISRNVLATDVDRGDIISLLKKNIDTNSQNTRNNISACELDFFWDKYPETLSNYIKDTDIILAADVVYVNEITFNFVKTLRQMIELSCKPVVIIYIAIEKRREVGENGCIVAPYYAYFEQCIGELQGLLSNERRIKVDEMLIDFPKYFDYNRVNELTLWKIEARL